MNDKNHYFVDTLFPYPGEPEPHGTNGVPSEAHFARRSALMPAFDGPSQATRQEKSHLSWQDNPHVDPTPIGKHDLERVAHLSSLGLLHFDPLSPQAAIIESLLSVTGHLLGAEYAFLSILDHQHSYELFPVFPQGPEAASLNFVRPYPRALKSYRYIPDRVYPSSCAWVDLDRFAILP